VGIKNVLFGKSTKNIPALCNIDLSRYLGNWYEIARLDQAFEKGLENVTATYSIQSDGKIEVLNGGTKNGAKQTIKGVATVPDKQCTGKLLVSFFWFFKSLYKIIRIEEQTYGLAVVTGGSMNYLWLLSRTPCIGDKAYDDFVSYVTSLGFDASKILRVNQDENRKSEK
jgi:lipocalin